jgi:hypothetical protein
MYLRVVLPRLPENYAWTSKVGHALINSVELNIGGTTIDKHYADWLNVWYEVARKLGHDKGYNKLIGNTPELTIVGKGTVDTVLWIPLYFFHCRNDGLALPLIATQYHDTNIYIQFNPLSSLVVNSAGAPALSGVSIGACSLYVDYVYLDSEERKKFAQASHEYLIEQLQFTGSESVTSQSSKFRLNFNHPCKALYWNVQQNQFTSGQTFLAYNPYDFNQTIIDASKRAVLAYTNSVLNGFFSVSVTGLTGSALAFATAINNIKLVYIDNPQITGPVSMTGLLLASFVITGVPLTIDYVSTPVASLPTIGSRLTVGPGAAASDIVVRQWDNYGTFLDKTVSPLNQVLLQLNGQDRFSIRDAFYFNYVQPWQCHTNTPVDGIFVYSFSLNPEEHQPSGTCNMSRIDNATLNLSFISTATVFSASAGPQSVNVSVSSGAICNIYATNYNVLRIMSGMAGLAYSN